MSPHRELDDLLAESVEHAIEREQTEFDRQAGPCAAAIVLFGAARMGQLLLSGLRRAGIEPLAFADNNPAMWGRSLNGIPVLSPIDAAYRFGDSAVFVIAIWGRGASDPMRTREARLRELGCRRVVSFGPLLWKYAAHFLPRIPALDLPHKVLQQAGDIQAAFDHLADERSRDEFVAQLRWRLRCDFDALPEPVDEPIYWPQSVVKLRDDETFVDCGAFDGDTIVAFLKFAGYRFHQAIAFEPDAASLVNLDRTLGRLEGSVRDRIRVIASATGAEKGTVRFGATGELGSAAGMGEIEVDVVPLDDALSGSSPTYIKMDIEGAEPDTLKGARGILRDRAPVLAVCAYHVQDHLWKLPVLIHSLNPEYRIFLRPHIQPVEDLVCYAVPPHRGRE